MPVIFSVTVLPSAAEIALSMALLSFAGAVEQHPSAARADAQHNNPPMASVGSICFIVFPLVLWVQL
jgi:hypothetical protein